MLRREDPAYRPPFALVDYKVLLGQRERGEPYAGAASKLVVRGELHHTAAEGNGPVNAIDAALRKALTAAYPEIAAIRLDDYKVRILDRRARPPGRPPRIEERRPR